MDRIWQKGPGTGNENVGTEKRTGSEKGSVGPAQGIPEKKGELETDNPNQPLHWYIGDSFPHSLLRAS